MHQFKEGDIVLIKNRTTPTHYLKIGTEAVVKIASLKYRADRIEVVGIGDDGNTKYQTVNIQDVELVWQDHKPDWGEGWD